jgi:uncharacterized protein DUF4167
MRPNNRQRSRGGRSGGGGGGGGHHHKQHHPHNPNRPPNRNQIFDSSGPDVRVRGNAHQVFDKYQALAREAAASGDRIAAEAYYQYADHYFRVIQSMGGFVQRNNWGEGGEEGQQGQQGNPQQQGGQQGNPQQQANGNGYDHRQGGSDNRQGGEHRQGGDQQRLGPRGEGHDETEPGLGGVAFLQNGRGAPNNQDPAADDQPDIPEFNPPAGGRRGERG